MGFEACRGGAFVAMILPMENANPFMTMGKCILAKAEE